nr:hypothetical protein [uncultured Oscillibacter sp.]
MKVSFYTIDDLRLGYDPKGVTGWRLSRFLSLADALEHYRSLSGLGAKSIGPSDGIHVLELIRHLPPFPDASEGLDTLAADYRVFPLWRECGEAADATEVCTSALRIRHRLINGRPIPMSAKRNTCVCIQRRPIS